MENFSDWNDSENEYSKDMKCLFCTEQYDSSSDLFLHCRQTHKFDFIELKLKLSKIGCWLYMTCSNRISF